MQLEVTNLSCLRGEQLILDGLSFEAAPGELLHVIGPNGSGKTTLLKLVCGLLEAEDGEITWDTGNGHSNFRDHIYLVGHRDGLKGSLTAFENLCFYQELNATLDESRVDEALNRLGLLDQADRLAGRLSFGQRRRLAFARLLLSDRPAWILDEPFTGVDTNGRSMMYQLCLEHLDRSGLIIMTHHGGLDSTILSSRVKVLEL